MATPPEPELSPPFLITAPEGGTLSPFVFNSPHSGRIYPRSFLAASRLDLMTLRRSEDSFVEELFSGAVGLGAPLMQARFPRAFVDVNREAYELDPAMFDGRLPSFANTRSMRVAGGLGTIARIVADGAEIYRRPIGVAEGLDRIERYYKPYHRALRQLVEQSRRLFGTAVVIDCHSMPSARMTQEARRRPDFVLGDRYGTSCASILTDVAQETLQRLGYTVARNKPYAGGFITETYGSPATGVHALQIEINRALYMDETRYIRAGGFAWLMADITHLCRRLMSISAEALRPGRQAAE
ncbi:N-formylglutamate amidohydrolase [Tepidamorphus gemmatus]|jgi:N-formylglutamate amidohydrolase|uniref:N-formylglutamate amidohydrolase n=1 Tax=Tepidamorphus gemmatus TaxID=747076 RepID=A0A4R3MHH6_9HYPH|nr:N-formylglutamate amidohydrolase [Tepidamorphus gemmatus]TCT13281.1 N-formylglutamate amidohydrolase [Tepidamorphus gemmatus]